MDSLLISVAVDDDRMEVRRDKDMTRRRRSTSNSSSAERPW
jgi:hypothetical protein